MRKHSINGQRFLVSRVVKFQLSDCFSSPFFALADTKDFAYRWLPRDAEETPLLKSASLKRGMLGTQVQCLICRYF